MGETDIKPDAELTARLDAGARKYIAEHQKQEEEFEHVALMTGMGLFMRNAVFNYQKIVDSGKTCFWGANEHLVTNIPFDVLINALDFEGMDESKYSSPDGLVKRRVWLSHSWDESRPGIYNPTPGDIEKLRIAAEIRIDDKEGIEDMKGSCQRVIERVFGKPVMVDMCQAGGSTAIPGPFFDAIRQAADAGDYFFFISGAYWPGDDYSNPENGFSIAYLPNK
jgi:hypothetical protein